MPTRAELAAFYEQRFLAKLAELGATPAYEKWLGGDHPHSVICKAGHDCSPRPVLVVKRGQGICGICARNSTAAAEEAFRRKLTELGFTPVYETWLGGKHPHKAICPRGHTCWPRPSGVLAGKGPCLACVGGDPVIAEAAFKARLAELGATPAWGKWLGNNKPHRAICKRGHECWPMWSSVQRGCGPCLTCAGKDAATLEAAFLERLAALGVTPAYKKWLGAMQPHRAICKAGHECRPMPSRIQQGQGPCRRCAGKSWDVFYIVANDRRRILKFGITSGDPRGRLADHRRRGYTRLVLVADAPLAMQVEAETKEALRLAGYKPVRGKEYFPVAALGVVQHVAMRFGLEDGFTPGVQLEFPLSAAA